jgi:WD40 repeat protein
MTGKVVQEFPAPRGEVYLAAWSPDGKTIVTAGWTLELRDVATGALLLQWAPPTSLAINSIAFSPDSKTLAVGDHDGTIWIFDLPAVGQPRSFKEDRGAIIGLAFHPGGSYLASVGHDGPLRLWDIPASHPVASVGIGVARGAVAVAFHPGGRLLAVAECGLEIWPAIQLWDVSSPSHPTRIGKLSKGLHQSTIVGLRFAPSGKYLISAGEEGLVCFWDVDTRAPMHPLRHLYATHALDLSANGTALAVAGNNDWVVIWDLLRSTDPSASHAGARSAFPSDAPLPR